jgi:glycosyltransferase involved in cell wall biosynthesis
MPSVTWSDGAVSPGRGPGGPRVLHVVPTALGRGAQVFARALVDELGGTEAGHRLVSLFDGEDGVKVDDTFGLPGGAGASAGLHPGALGAVVRQLRRFDHDLVVAHGGDAFKYLALSSPRPIAYCVIGTWPSSARRAQRLAWTALARRAWRAVPVSEDVADDCRAVLSLRGDRVTVIPNGRDDRTFVPAPHPSTGIPTLLFVGHLNEGKRPRLFVQLLERLRAQGLAVSGRMVGTGPLGSELARRAAEAGIEMVGWSNDVVSHMQDADIFVFPSAPDGEGMPGVLIEAGLCGLPAVSTRVAGASTVIEDGRTGCLVGVDDIDGLARATAALIGDPGRRIAMGEAARSRCEHRFALSVVAAQWDQLIRNAPARRGRIGPGHRAPLP